MTLREILKFYWGYDSFRPLQKEMIEAVLKDRDVIGVLPTGSGKSIIYQVAGIKKEGLTIVISPLIALIEDQVQRLNSLGIKALALTGNIPPNELSRLMDNALYSHIKFLFLSPERLQNTYVTRRLINAKIGLIVIDEAHCISEWGHDFRPSYLKISILRDLHPETPVLALTATAKEEVIQDIIKQLKLREPLIFKQSIQRENLAFKVYKTENKLGSLLQKLQHDETSIIYVRTRKRTYQLASILSENAYKAGFFHGGMSYKEKQRSLNNWLLGKTKIMVATNAFGMGIDKSNVRKVFHLDLPGSLENYLQEAGRAGRDGKYAEAILFFTQNDIDFYTHVFIDKLPGIKEVLKVYNSIYNHFYVAEGEGEELEFDFDYKAFCTRFDLPFQTTLDILKILESEGILILNNSKRFFAKAKILASAGSIRDYVQNNRKFSLLLDLLIRRYSDIFHQHQKLNLKFFQENFRISESELQHQFLYLQKSGYIDYKPKGKDFSIRFLLPKDSFLLQRKTKAFEKRLKIKQKQFQSLINYVLNDKKCRAQQLAAYFEEEEGEKCGICDVCEREKNEYSSKEITEKILKLLDQNSYSLEELSSYFHKDISFELKFLFDRKKIIFDIHSGKYKRNQNEK